MQKKKMKKFRVLLAAAAGLWMIGPLAYFVAGVLFDRECRGFLKRAADSNSVELAETELARALAYCRLHRLDKVKETGHTHTSVVYETPDEDIVFWYKNLAASHAELQEIIFREPSATPLEKSNVLIKLRETLLDKTQGGMTVTYPTGLHVYPHNFGFAVVIGGPVVLIFGLFGYLMLWGWVNDV